MISSRKTVGPRQRVVRVQAVNVEQLKAAKEACEELVKKANCAPILVRLGVILSQVSSSVTYGLDSC